MTPAASYAGSNNGSVPSSSEILSLDTNLSLDRGIGHHESNPDVLKQALLKQPLDDEVRLAMLKNASASKMASLTSIEATSKIYLNQNESQNEFECERSPPPAVPKRSTSYDLAAAASNRENVVITKLSPPTPFADESFVADTLPHLMSKQAEARDPGIGRHLMSKQAEGSTMRSCVMSKTLPRKMPTGKLNPLFDSDC